MDAPAPKKCTRVESLLGLINYHGKFIPNSTRIVHSLNNLSRVTSKWQQSPDCTKAIQELKRHLSTSVL